MTSKTSESIKVNCYAKGGKLVLGNVEVKNMAEARRHAAEWNKGNKVSRIDIIWSTTGLCSAIY